MEVTALLAASAAHPATRSATCAPHPDHVAAAMSAPRVHTAAHAAAHTAAHAATHAPAPSPSIYFPALLPDDLHPLPPTATAFPAAQGSAPGPAPTLSPEPAPAPAPAARAREAPLPGKRRRQETRELRRVTSKRYRDALGGLYAALERLVPVVLPAARLRTKSQIIARAAEALRALAATAARADARAALHAPEARAAWVAAATEAARTDDRTTPYGATAACRLARLLVDYRWAYAEVWTEGGEDGEAGEGEDVIDVNGDGSRHSEGGDGAEGGDKGGGVAQGCTGGESDNSSGGRDGEDAGCDLEMKGESDGAVEGLEVDRARAMVRQSFEGAGAFRMRRSFRTLDEERFKEAALAESVAAEVSTVVHVAATAEPAWQVLVGGDSGSATGNDGAAGWRGSAARRAGFVVTCALPLVVHGSVQSVVVLFNDTYSSDDRPHLAVAVDLGAALGDRLSYTHDPDDAMED